MHIFPKNINFFDMFDKQTEKLTEANVILQSLGGIKELPAKVAELHAVEQAADTITHDIFRALNQIFITPIDREDIVVLAGRLDDVIDAMDRAVNRMGLYKVAPDSREIQGYARLLDPMAAEICKALHELKGGSKNQQQILKHCEIINFMENQVDAHNRDCIADLFTGKVDAVEIIKLKEIYETLESVADRCEDVANALETIVVKNQ